MGCKLNSLLVFNFWQDSRGRRKQNEKIDLHAFCSGCCAALQPFLINCVKIFNFAAVFAESSCMTLLSLHPQLKQSVLCVVWNVYIIAIVFYCRKITILKAPGMDVDSYLLSLYTLFMQESSPLCPFPKINRISRQHRRTISS